MDVDNDDEHADDGDYDDDNGDGDDDDDDDYDDDDVDADGYVCFIFHCRLTRRLESPRNLPSSYASMDESNLWPMGHTTIPRCKGGKT